MMDLSILTNAAKLHGYLVATKAPKTMVLLAEEIIEAATKAVSDGQRVELHGISADAVSPEQLRTSAEGVQSAQETAPRGYSRVRLDGEGWVKESLRVRTPTHGDGLGDVVIARENIEPEVSANVIAPEQVQPEKNELHKTVSATATASRASVSPVVPAIDVQTARGRNPENTWEDWQIKTLIRMKREKAKAGAIAAAINKTPQQINNKWTWLPNTIKQAVLAPDDDEWPEAVKLAKEPVHEPRMRFTTVKARTPWGEREHQVPLPSGEYKDPATGAKVTKYPAGYAIGTGPQRNISVKGGA